jgi:predicted hotdog family 3-hydroxylacyl-ACP dehydratase
MIPAPLPDVRDLVPHQPPMLLLDALRSCAEDSVTCTVTIRPDSMFAEGHDGERRVPAVVGLEYMAQSVAVYAGLTARRAGRPPRIGFLIGCRELRLEVEGFSVGDTLDVEVRRLWGESDLGSFACAVRRAGEILVSGTLSVYQGTLPEESRP